MRQPRTLNPQPRRSGRRMLAVASIAAALLALAAGIAALSRGGGPAPATAPQAAAEAQGRPLSGLFTLWNAAASDDACALPPGYEDIAAGAPVVVKGDGGAVIARATLSAGTPRPERNGCSFAFTIGALPDAAAYNVEVGRRGGLTYSHGDLESMGWKVAINLGIQGANSARVQAGQP